jgi:hypothetical protein
MKTLKDQQKEANKRIKWLFISFMSAIIILVVFLCVSRCQPPKTDLSKVVLLGNQRDSVQTKIDTLLIEVPVYRDRWHKAKDKIDTLYKHDTIIQEAIQSCDELVNLQDSLIDAYKKKDTISGSLIFNQDLIIHRKDQELNMRAERQCVFLGADVATDGQVFVGGYFDTKKALFGASYSLNSKQFRVSVHIKIKLWKRANQ